MSLTTTLSALLLLAVASNVQAAATFQTNITETGLYTKEFGTFAIVNFPPCQYSGQTAVLKINSSLTRKEFTIYTTVPQCRTRRDAGAVILSDSTTGNIVTRNIGVRVENLKSNNTYRASYSIPESGATSPYITFMTRNVQNFTDIPDTMRRSGGMVVITVLLSIAMAILILGLVGSLVTGGSKI
ncbi:uroplakin-2 [Pleurodeles waltl]